MILQEGALRFDFSGALEAFKFDEQDKTSPTCHGLSHCMKAVDFVVEYADHYLFVEVKDPRRPDRFDSEPDESALVKSLVTKFRDTFLYRWAEGKLDKPVRYQCLIELDNAQTLHLMKQLKNQLPTNGPSKRWRRPLAQLCAVVNQATWNRAFANVQVERVGSDA